MGLFFALIALFFLLLSLFFLSVSVFVAFFVCSCLINAAIPICLGPFSICSFFVIIYIIKYLNIKYLNIKYFHFFFFFLSFFFFFSFPFCAMRLVEYGCSIKGLDPNSKRETWDQDTGPLENSWPHGILIGKKLPKASISKPGPDPTQMQANSSATCHMPHTTEGKRKEKKKRKKEEEEMEIFNI